MYLNQLPQVSLLQIANVSKSKALVTWGVIHFVGEEFSVDCNDRVSWGVFPVDTSSKPTFDMAACLRFVVLSWQV
jgi:hypothetical protein